MKTVKRVTAMLCVIIVISSAFMVPASAASWTFQFGANNGSSNGSYYSANTKYVTISKFSTRWGSWTPVYFRFKGSGIQQVQVIPWYTNQNRPVQAYIKYVNWRPAGQWCTGCIMVRGLWGGTGDIDVILRGSDFVIRNIRIQ